MHMQSVIWWENKKEIRLLKYIVPIYKLERRSFEIIEPYNYLIEFDTVNIDVAFYFPNCLGEKEIKY